jgi:hypothetical protein
MRDEGLMQMAVTLKSRESITDLVKQIPGKAAGVGMEALYRVRGMHRMNIASRLVFASTLRPTDIWVDSPDFRAAAGARSSSDDAGR